MNTSSQRGLLVVALASLLACGSNAGPPTPQGAQGPGPLSERVGRTSQADTGPVTQISPTGTQTTDVVPFSWTADSTATSYAVWVTADGTNGVYYDTYTPTDANCSSGTGTCTTASASLPAGTLSWYVQVTDSGGAEPWVGPMSFTTTAPSNVTQVSPTGTQSGDSVSFSWTALSAATSYAVWVSADGDNGIFYQTYDPTSANCASGTGNCTTAAAALPAGTLYWSVQATTSGGAQPWVGPMSFTTPTLVTQIGPTGTQPGSTVAFSWQAVSTATNYAVWVTADGENGVYYNTYSPTDANCSSGTGTCTTAAVSLPVGALSWGLQVTDSGGAEPWVDMTFTMAPEATPTGPTGFQASDSNEFTWDAVSGATEYIVWVTQDGINGVYYSTFTPSEANCPSGSGPCWSSLVTLPSGAYSWSLQVQYGSTSSLWAGPTSFTNP